MTERIIIDGKAVNAVEFMDGLAGAYKQVVFQHNVIDPSKELTDPDRCIIHNLVMTKDDLAKILRDQFTDVRIEIINGQLLTRNMLPFVEIATAWLRESRLRELELGECRQEIVQLKQDYRRKESAFDCVMNKASELSRELEKFKTWRIFGYEFKFKLGLRNAESQRLSD